jgi:hypothetical protein
VACYRAERTPHLASEPAPEQRALAGGERFARSVERKPWFRASVATTSALTPIVYGRS